jgi:hypothetical protein
MTEINDNKKLTVDEYRRLIYGAKRSQSSSAHETKSLANNRKSASYTRLGVQTEPNEASDPDEQDKKKPGLKYVRSKELLKTIQYNKSAGTINTNANNDPTKDKKMEKTTDSRKDPLKDPTRITYISKTTFTPKYSDPKLHSPGNIASSSSISYHSTQNNCQNGLNNSVGVPQKTGMFFSSPSAGNIQKKPVLFKSSKYIINKTEESHKE